MSKWPMVRLGEVTTVVAGSTPSTFIDEYWNGPNCWVTPAELSDDVIVVYDTERKITDLAVEKTGLKPMPAGTVLLSSRAPIGKVSIAGCVMYCNQGFKNLICGERVFNKYLFWFLKCRKEYLISLGRGATFKEISKTIVEDINIPLPPLKAQRQIAKVLDKTQEIIGGHKRQLEELDNFVKATFHDMFGDPLAKSGNPVKVPLSEIVDIIMGQSPPGDSYNREGLGSPLLNGPTEFGDLYPKEVQWTKSPTKLCVEGDILFCVRGATAGRMNLADKEYCIGRGLAAIRTKNKGSRDFIYVFLQAMYGHFQSTSDGSTFINISRERLESSPIINPTKEELLIFSQFVTNIGHQKSLVKQSLADSQNLFNSLMSRYFD